MIDAVKHDPHYGHEALCGEHPVPFGSTCHYENGTFCMHAVEKDDGHFWCEKYKQRLYVGYAKLIDCK